MSKMVSIIILNWNGREILRNCLNSIKKHTKYKNHEVIVVDQGSKDGSIEMLRKEFPYVRLVRNKENVGIPKGSNQGMKIAKGDYFIFLGNDTLVTDGWMEALVEVAESDSRIASVGATLIDKKQMGMVRPENYEKRRASVCSAAMLMKRKAFDYIGYYDEKNFTPYGGDETDWNLQAWNLGYKVIETKRSVVVHIGSVDTKRQNPNQYLLLNTNRLKAILYNVSPLDLIKRLPGLGLIFVFSLFEGKTLVLLKSYWNNIKNYKNILEERRKRREKIKKLEKLKKEQGEAFY